MSKTVSLGVVRQGIVDVRVKRLLKQATPRPHLLVLRAQSPRGGPRLELYTVPHGYSEGSSKVKVCRSAGQLFMVTERMTFFCKSEFEQKRWIDDIRRVFFGGRIMPQPMDNSKPDVYPITLAKLEAGVWKAEANALVEIGLNNMVILNSLEVNPLYMVPLVNIMSVKVVGSGRSDEMREIRIQTKGANHAGAAEFVLWSFLCDDIALSLQRRLGRGDDLRTSIDYQPSNSLEIPNALKSKSISNLMALSPSDSDPIGNLVVSSSIPTTKKVRMEMLNINEPQTKRTERNRAASMKSKKLRRFGSDSDISHCPEEEEDSDDDSFEVPPALLPPIRYAGRRSRSEVTGLSIDQELGIGHQQMPEFSSIDETSVDEDEDDYSQIDGEGEEDNNDEDYSRIREENMDTCRLQGMPVPAHHMPSHLHQRIEKNPSCPVPAHLHQRIEKNTSCPVVNVTVAEKHDAALKPIKITDLKQRYAKPIEQKPTKLVTNGEQKGRSSSMESCLESRESVQPSGHLRSRSTNLGKNNPPVPRPKPLPRPNRDGQPILNLPIPPPKPKPTPSFNSPPSSNPDASHTLESSREAVDSTPCNCGENEERLRLPVRDIQSQIKVCGEETGRQAGPYSYIVVRGTENQSSKPQNPIFPDIPKKRVASKDARRQKWRAPAALPRPAHTLPEEDDDDSYDYLNLQETLSDSPTEIHSNAHRKEHVAVNNGSLYENIDIDQGLYVNIGQLSPSSGTDSMATEQVAKDIEIPRAGFRKRSNEELPKTMNWPRGREAVNSYRRGSEDDMCLKMVNGQNETMAMYSNVFDDEPYQNVHLSGPG